MPNTTSAKKAVRKTARRTAINLAYTTPGYVPRMTESAAKLYAE